ncbi:sugar ABC transporter permease [Candidatus Bipolaricaulota bacterium]|nr:sugar ABC transporter permease [Candidatus Bipolaricaulota bacterium]
MYHLIQEASGWSPGANWDSLQAREARLAWGLVSPTALVVFGLIIFPAFFSGWISFHDVSLRNLSSIFSAPFVGLENYHEVVSDWAFKFHSWRSWGAAITSVVYSVVSTALTILVGLVAALLLNRKFKARGLVRATFLFPYVAPIVSVAFVWRWILDPQKSGVLNDILLRLGAIQDPQAYLSTRGLALILVIAFTAWRYFPFAMLMILARLQAIDGALYESASVDGATSWQKFRYITIPELRYVLGAVFMLRLIWTFNKFDDIFLLTGGGYGTNVLPILTYQFSFRSFDFGKGAATAMILLGILLVFLGLYVGFFVRRGEAA